MHLLSILSILVFGLSTMKNYNSSADVEKGPFKRSILLVGLCVSWWAFTSSQFYIADTKEAAWFWHRLSAIAWLLIIPETALYMLYMTGRGEIFSKLINRIIFFFLPCVLIFYSLFGKGTPLATEVVQSGSGLGWTYTNRINSIWLWLYIFTLVTYMGGAIFITAKDSKVNDFQDKATLGKCFAILDTVILTTGFITDVVFPLHSSYFVPVANILNIVPVLFYIYMSDMYDTVHIERYISSEVIFKTSTAAFLVMDEEGKIFFSNKKADELFSREEEGLKGVYYKSLIVDDENYHEALEEFKANKCFYDKVIHISKNDIIHSFMMSISEAYDKRSRFLGYVVSCQDVTKIISVTELLEKQNNTDEVTNLPNRHCFFETANKYIKVYEEANLNFGVVFIDLDRFKGINDTYGHAFGDRVLIKVGEILKGVLKDNEILFRIGGDEFVILINDVNIIDRINELENRLDTVLSGELVIEGNVCDIDISYGSDLYSESKNLEDLINKADNDMYKNKKAKKFINN